MAFFSEATMSIANRDQYDWWRMTESDLYNYARFEHIIRRKELRLEELRARKEDGGRVSSGGWGEVEVTTGNHAPWVEYIVTEIADIEAEIQYMQEFREMVELAVDYEFSGEAENKEFIRLYYWSGLRKRVGREVIMAELHLSRSTFYDWRGQIVERMARVLGHKKA